MRTIANGYLVNYSLDGPEDAPVVTLSHSLAASLEMWEPQMPALTGGYRVLRYDIRGHGGSEAPPGAYDLDMLAGDVLGLLAALGIERTHFIGLSLGGMIGQNIALGKSGVLAGLVLADTMSQFPEEARGVWNDRMDTAATKGMAELVESTIERWFTPPFVDGSPRAVEGIRHLIRATPPTGFIGCCHAILGLDYRDRLAAVATPTLIVVGEDDPGTPVAASQAMHEGIPSSRLAVIPGAAHLSNIEQAERFNREILEFLDGL